MWAWLFGRALGGASDCFGCRDSRSGAGDERLGARPGPDTELALLPLRRYGWSHRC